MYAILRTIADQAKKKAETHQAVLRFKSGGVMHVEEFLDVRTNHIHVRLNYASAESEAHFLPEAVEAVELRCR